MNNKRLAELLLVSIVILIAVPTTFARPEYLTNLTAVYGAGSCNTCHLNGASDGPRTVYGTLFENQANHDVANASAALRAIGAPPNATVKATVTTTMAATPEVTEETAIPEVGETAIVEETSLVEGTTETTPEVTTVTVTTTPKSPGFGLVVSMVGLFAWAILIRRKNK
ncbi:Uncharacterised protein [uncultured archaeon]|nr:Uncharacterised protein [uncultured archaeon]